MKRSFMVFVLTVLSLLLAAGAAFAQEPMGGMETQPAAYSAARNQISFSLGPYYPTEDNDDPFEDDWETGVDFTATYTRLIGSHLAIEAGLHAYATHFDDGPVEGERVSSGVEVMALFVPIHTRIMPYIGGGLGFYNNHLKVEVNNSDVVDDDGSAAGVVIKGGVRAHMTQRFYLGGFVKAWTNNQKIEFENGDDETFDFGGTSVNFEVGFAL